MTGKSLFDRVLVVFQISALLLMPLVPSFAQRTKKADTPEGTYSNTSSITINTTSGLTAPTVAATYPSQINVSGMSGTTTRVAVTLSGVTSSVLNRLDFLLVSPTGAKYIFASDLGGANTPFTVYDKVYTFADDAAGTFPTGTQFPASGTYRPTSGDTNTDTFPSPAPAAPYLSPSSTTLATAFNGADPNGAWSLYAVSDTLNGAHELNEGWALNVTTSGTAATNFSNANPIFLYDDVAISNPYGTAINVTGASGVVSKVTVTLNGFSHANPQNVDVLLVSPNGKSVIVMSDAGSTAAVSGLDLTFDDAASTSIGNTLITSGTYRTSDINQDNFDEFPSPAPLPPNIPGSGADRLSSFNGFSPNGEWKLYVVDDSQISAGSISGGWSLNIDTTPVVPPSVGSCAVPSFSPSSFSVGANPTNVAVADFNNDGDPDVAVTNQVSNDVSILLNNGNGTFAPQTTVSAGTGPYAIVAGSFNADSNIDLAVANSTSNNVSILLGNGSGGFAAPVNFFVGPNPISIAAGDVNNDGKTDLATANFGGFFSGSVSVLLGNGIGGFTSGNMVRTRTQPSYVLLKSFTGDSSLDMIVANFGADSVTTFTGDGAGNFTLLQNLSTDSGPVAVAAADFTGSSSIDLAIANYNSDSVTTCIGAANGLFTCGAGAPANGANPIAITAGPFLGGSVNTLAVALSGSNYVRMLNFVPVVTVAVGQSPNAINSADFNGDGRLDIVTVNSGSNNVSILLNSCLVASGNLFDFNGDQRTDFTVYRASGENWWVAPNPTSVRTLARPTDVIVPADYTGDKRTDYGFYRPETGRWAIISEGNLPVYFAFHGVPGDIPVPHDFDGDGKADLSVFRRSNGNWYVRRSTDNEVQVTNFGMNGDLPVPADYDADGKGDIAVFRPSNGSWYIVRSSDSQLVIQQFGMMGDKTVPADYDGDGKADIAVWRPATGSWFVLKSSDGNVMGYNWGMMGDIAVPGDYEGDGKFDYAVFRPSDGFWYVLKSSDSAPIYQPWGLSTDIPIPSAYVR